MPVAYNRLLSTKILPENLRQKLNNAGFVIEEIEFIKINYLPVLPDIEAENIILTSNHALKSLLLWSPVENLKKHLFFVVGNKTCQELRLLGLQVKEEASYSEQLADIIIKNHSDKKFTYYSGNLRRDVLPEKLKANQILLKENISYETILNPIKIDKCFDTILFFSPSGVSGYLVNNKLNDAKCLCIGNTTAAALAEKTRNIFVAKSPSIESLIELCIHQIKN